MKRCEIVTVDGQPVRVQLDGGDLTEEDRDALAEVVRAARAKLAAMPPGPLSVACPTCGAEPGNFCRNQHDRVTGVHSAPTGCDRMTIVRIGGNGTAPGSSLWMWCPGCDVAHRITVGSSDSWTWDGDEAAPTINPSILVHSHKTFDADRNIVDTPQCHSFVVGGEWQFLPDCTHPLAGQRVPMVPLPDWLSEEYVG